MKRLKWEDAKKEINTGLVFLEFATEWCGDCKMMESVVDDTEKKIKEENVNAEFIRVDAEEAKLFRESNSEFQVLKVPSFFVIKDGVKKHIGYKYFPVEALVDSIKNA